MTSFLTIGSGSGALSMTGSGGGTASLGGSFCHSGSGGRPAAILRSLVACRESKLPEQWLVGYQGECVNRRSAGTLGDNGHGGIGVHED